MKRHTMPHGWKISRKGKKYTVAPSSGPHAKKECIPLMIVVRDILGYAQTGDEAKSIINTGAVLVDGVVRKDYRFPAGFMDAITIKPTGEHFRVMLGAKGLFLEKIGAAESSKKLCIVRRKFTIRGQVQCMALHDGRVLRLGKGRSEYKPGETVAIEVPSQKIAGHFKVEKGANALITGGKNMGMHGKIKEIRDRKFMTEKSVVILESEGKEIETLKDYIMVTDGKVSSHSHRDTSDATESGRLGHAVSEAHKQPAAKKGK
jgi:small subunit ribosomal protein S4e